MTANVLKFSTPIRPAVLATDPSSTENGVIYYNSTSTRMRYFEGGQWQEVASRAYALSLAAGLDPKESVFAATLVALPSSVYDNGVSGVGATLTGSVNGALPAIDGVALAVGRRLLVKNQASETQNGIYVVSDMGGVSSPFVLTRSSDFDGSPVNEIDGGEYTFVRSGSQAGSGWVVIGLTASATLGTTAITFTQFSDAAASLQAAYIGGNTVTTSVSEGDFVIAGTEQFHVTANNGIRVTLGASSVSGLLMGASLSSTAQMINLINDGSGSNLSISSTNAANINAGISISQQGTGSGISVNMTNAASTADALDIIQAGTGYAIDASTTGTGGGFKVALAASSTLPAIMIDNASTAMSAEITTPESLTTSNPMKIYTGNAAGGDSGSLILQSGTASGTRGELIINTNFVARGKSTTLTLEQEYFHVETLAASSSNAAIPDFQFAHASFEGLKIDYKIKEATTNAIRVGTLYIGTNGILTTLSDFFSETADVGVAWTAVIVGSNVEVRYTTTANTKTMRADVTRIRA